ncbi:MAG: MFS transporter [Clostridia bacterium]|nr:MFS transporter [Clostridia bacterium]
MTDNRYKRTKFACYAAYFTMSSIFCLPPMLFVTLRETFGISYTLLGTLVLVNFCTQLTVDLIFTFFSKKFNVKAIVKVMPLITALGLVIYALVPTLFPNIAYAGLVVGTVVFSVSAGFSEVLLSPMIATIPSDNPQKDMSMLHSLYAFGVLFVVVVSTVFFALFTTASWMHLTLFFALLPVIASVLFFTSPMPDMDTSQSEASVAKSSKRTLGLVLCVACIFFGSCAENAMSNWVSGFMENALGIDKSIGDILGLAMFAVLLGLGRIAYAKWGKNISKILLFGMIGASACYLVVGLVDNVILAVSACFMTGLFTSMLWPGTLILMEEKLPSLGVGAYALMAASGDLGASVAPQLMGVVADSVAGSALGAEIGVAVGLTAEQVGLKAGMLVTSLFPILGIVVVLIIMNYFKPKKQESLLKTE